jgi:hypothetical protein
MGGVPADIAEAFERSQIATGSWPGRLFCAVARTPEIYPGAGRGEAAQNSRRLLRDGIVPADQFKRVA